MNRPAQLFARLEKVAPLLVMGTLTLLSFSLLKSTSIPNPSQAAPNRSEYDYYVDQFSSAQLNASGQLTSLVRGRHALHSLVTKNIFVDDFVFTSNNKTNRYFGQSESAELDDDGNNLIMRTNAILDRNNLAGAKNAMTRIKSNHLHLIQYPERLISNTFTEIMQEKRIIFAQSMQYDSDEQKMHLFGNVKIKVAKK
jgi:LPS export ABC transporter protein LptC